MNQNEPIRLLKFLKVLFLVLKAIRLFRWRTKFRNFKLVTNRQIQLVNDNSHVNEEPTQRNKISFIKNKFLRLKFLVMKKKFKKIHHHISINKKKILFIYLFYF